MQHVDRRSDQENLFRPETALADHLVPLPGGDWALWKYVVLRGTGFPVTGALQLAAPECAAAADSLLRAEAAREAARQHAIALLDAEIDALRAAGKWDDLEARGPLIKSIRMVKNCKRPGGIGLPSHIQAAIQVWADAIVQADEASPIYNEKFQSAIAHISKVIREAVQVDRFREAVICQSRHAYRTGLKVMLSHPSDGAKRGTKEKQYEELAANYLQRYCLKNDTIGFFGPVGWANLVSEDIAIDARPGKNLIDNREVYFESWCIDALAEKLSSDPRMHPWLFPRAMPYIRLEGCTLHMPYVSSQQLTKEEAAILSRCDGRRPARVIADELLESNSLNLRRVEEVYKVLETFKLRGLIIWSFEIPTLASPEKLLGELLEQIGDAGLRKEALDALEELESARKAIAASAGDSEKYDEAMGELESTFTRLTGVASTRAAGELYAARTLVYEECRRDIKVDIGSEILNNLGPTLSLLLTSARWITAAAAKICNTILERIYDEMVEQTGETVIEAVNLWVRFQPFLYEKRPDLAEQLAPVFQKRWAKVLALPEGQHRVNYSSKQLKPLVELIFHANKPGWKVARYHSPDVMIMAPSQEAIRRGDYTLIMGELHVSANTLGAWLFVTQHPRKEELFKATIADIPEPRLVPVNPKKLFNVTTRTHSALVMKKDYRVVLSQDSVISPEFKAIPISALVIEKREKGLVLRTRDGKLSFDLVESIGDLLSLIVINSFTLLPRSRHNPRIMIDRVIVSRESWSLPCTEYDFAFEKDERNRFLLARRWAQNIGVPRFVFAKTPVEAKPFFIDFESPIYVNILAKMVRRTHSQEGVDALVTVTEMVPGPDTVWLEDAEGQKYTSELRFVAVDTLALSQKTSESS